MPGPTPQQIRMRERFEAVLGVAAPVLDLVLAAGDRLSRVAGPENEYYPIRPPGEAFELSPVSRPDPAADESPELPTKAGDEGPDPPA